MCARSRQDHPRFIQPTFVLLYISCPWTFLARVCVVFITFWLYSFLLFRIEPARYSLSLHLTFASIWSRCISGLTCSNVLDNFLHIAALPYEFTKINREQKKGKMSNGETYQQKALCFFNVTYKEPLRSRAKIHWGRSSRTFSARIWR